MSKSWEFVQANGADESESSSRTQNLAKGKVKLQEKIAESEKFMLEGGRRRKKIDYADGRNRLFRMYFVKAAVL